MREGESFAGERESKRRLNSDNIAGTEKVRLSEKVTVENVKL